MTFTRFMLHATIVATAACADVPSEEALDSEATFAAQTFDYRAHQAAIDAKFAQVDQPAKNALGAPLRGAQPCDDSRRTECSYQPFRGGRIYYMPESGHREAYAMYGLIYEHWVASGRFAPKSSTPTAHAESLTGIPATDERGTPDGRGRYVFFRGGSVAAIYFTPQTGAVSVRYGVYAAWKASGWEAGAWGYPVRPEVQNDGRCGPSIDIAMQDFERGTACIDLNRSWFIPYDR